MPQFLFHRMLPENKNAWFSENKDASKMENKDARI